MATADKLYAQLKQSYPGMDWEMGSAVREMVLQPLATGAAVLDAELAARLSAENLQTLLDNPDTNKAAVLAMAEKLGIQAPAAIAASGTILLYLNSGDDYPVAKGTVYNALGATLTAIDNIIGTADSSKTATNYRQFTESGAEYILEVPVELSSVFTATIQQGTAVTNLSGSSLVSAEIGQTVSGGRAADSIYEIAARVKDFFFPVSYNTADAAEATLRRQLPDVVSSAKAFGAGHPAAGGITNLFGVDVGGSCSIYTRTLKGLNTFYKNYTFLPSGSTLSCTISGIAACGIFDITELEYNGVVYSAGTFAKTRTGIPGTSLQSITVSIVSLETAEAVVKATLSGVPDLPEVQSLLDSSSTAAPYRMLALPPVIAEMTMSLYVTGDATQESTVKAAICAMINSLPINKGGIGDREISQVLSGYVYTLSSGLYGCSLKAASWEFRGGDVYGYSHIDYNKAATSGLYAVCWQVATTGITLLYV